MLIVKSTLMKIADALVGLKAVNLSWQVANTNQITKVAGSAKGIKLPDGNYVVFFSLGFKTSTTRGASTAVFRLVSDDGYLLEATCPYWFTGLTSGSMGNIYANDPAYYFLTNTSWTANTEVRVQGVGYMRKTSTLA